MSKILIESANLKESDKDLLESAITHHKKYLNLLQLAKEEKSARDANLDAMDTSPSGDISIRTAVYNICHCSTYANCGVEELLEELRSRKLLSPSTISAIRAVKKEIAESKSAISYYKLITKRSKD